MSQTWTTPDGVHRVEVMPSNSGKRRAWCKCGWQGELRLHIGKAAADGVEHLSAVTHDRA